MTKHRAEAVKRQLEAAAAVKEAGDSLSPPTEASAAKSAKMRKENADAEVDALNSLDKKFRDSNGGGGTGGDPGKQGVGCFFFSGYIEAERVSGNGDPNPND